MNGLCSVIVPIYNVEKYVKCCVTSLLEQDYEQIEIILVDDGSTDNSGKILDELIKKENNNVVLIHKDNGGVSSARNTGLKRAKGKYIMFVDGDDFVEKNYVSSFVNLLEKTNAELGVSYNRLQDHQSPSRKKIYYDTISSNSALEDMYLEKLDVAVWNKIYRKDFLDNYNISFQEQFWFAEGMTFNVACYLAANTIATTNCEVYHQVSNNNSAVRKFNLKSWYCGQYAMLFQRKMLIAAKTNMHVLNAWAYHYFGYDFVIFKGLYLLNDHNNYRKEMRIAKRNLRKNIFLPLKARVCLKKKIKCIAQALFPIILIKKQNLKIGPV